MHYSVYGLLATNRQGGWKIAANPNDFFFVIDVLLLNGNQ